MLAHVVHGAGLLVGKVVSLVTGEGDMLLVLRPRDPLGVKQIGNSGDIGRNVVEII